ncbi:MAG: DUF6503 family protein [Bacteroidota bacterium]
MRYSFFFSPLLLFVACGAPPLTAEEVIDRAIEVHYSDYYEQADLEFAFRDKTYGIQTDGGEYVYTRSFGDTVDRVANEGFSRTAAGELVAVSDSMAGRYANSVNSVRYFFMLPYGLHEPAVNTQLLGERTLRGEPYYELRITFAEEDGGDDYDDVYHYFFHRESGELDYLAYSFTVNGGGVRFREAINKRRVDGLLVQDYINYKPKQATPVANLAGLLETDGLKELSRIENTAIRLR